MGFTLTHIKLAVATLSSRIDPPPILNKLGKERTLTSYFEVVISLLEPKAAEYFISEPNVVIFRFTQPLNMTPGEYTESI